MAFRKHQPSGNAASISMVPLDFPCQALEKVNSVNPVMSADVPSVADVDIDMREVYFLIMHFLSQGPFKRTFGELCNELLEHQLLPRRYYGWYSRGGFHSGEENDDGISLPLGYLKLVERYPHIGKDHLVKLLKQLIVSSCHPHRLIGGGSPNAADVPTLLGSNSFSLLASDRGRQDKETPKLSSYLRWPHIQADQVHGLSMREIGGFTKHRRAPSVRASCYAIAKPSTLVEKMQIIKRLRGHQNAVYCATFDRTGRYVITGSDDRLVKIWAMETAFCLASCRGHEGDITDLAVSSNNAVVASSSNDFIIRVWRMPDGLPISVLKGHTGAVTAIAFSPRPGAAFQLLSYEKCHDLHGGGEEESRTSNYADSVNNYYDFATSTFENRWGESFHFANRWHGETLRESIKRQEHFVALQLGLKKGMKVLDVGCGIGGPLREIARFSSASVTGLNINGLQISRGQELNALAGLSEQCNFVEADFMNMPFPDDAFDAVYAIEATCDAPDALACYSEICRVLKRGQHFALHEWCVTDGYDPDNERHRSIKAEIESSDGLPEIRSTRQCIQALKGAGFEVIWEKDLAEESPVPWYSHLDPSGVSWASFRRTRAVRFISRAMPPALKILHLLSLRFLCLLALGLQLKTLEALRVVPQGSARVSGFLGQAANGLVKGGKEGIFTPMFFVLARKPR